MIDITEAALLLSIITFLAVFNLLLLVTMPDLCQSKESSFEYTVNETIPTVEATTGWLDMWKNTKNFVNAFKCDTQFTFIYLVINAPVVLVLQYLIARLIRGGG